MRILHCCLSNFYIDNYNYQENVLPRFNKADGHDVLIMASTETILNNRNLSYVEPSEYINNDGIKVIRIPYRTFLPKIFMIKLRSYKGVLKHIDEFKPDIILFHGTAAYEIMNLAKYKKNHTNVKFFVDSHEDFNNSARNFLSKQILHRCLYKSFIHKALLWIDKILYISLESYDFLHNFYKIPNDKLEFYPLGGTIYEGVEYQKRREKIRIELQLGENDILIVHSGKMNRNKRTPELLHAFKKVQSNKIRLILIGDIPDDMQGIIYPLIENDTRIKFIGWKSSDVLHDYLCAADLYAQPGSQSATMQNAICCGCPVMLYPYKSHEIYVKDNGFFVKTVEDMAEVFNTIKSKPDILKNMQEASLNVAREILDYRKLAARLYE